MKTNTAYTNEILNSYADINGKIDINYFAHCVEIVADNNKSTSDQKYNTRRKTRNIAIDWLMYFIKTELYFAGYENYYATSKQVMQWDKNHAGQLEKVLDKVEKYITDEQNENN